jgi:sRNA-binding regulator protein Hfq
MYYEKSVKYRSEESINDRNQILYRHAISGIISYISDGLEGNTTTWTS